MNADYLVQEPRQSRSQHNMDKIINAAAELLETKSFDDLTLSEVVNRAGTSIGAFYGRFKDKEALLHALDERFFRRFAADFENLSREGDPQEKKAPEIVREAIGYIAGVYHRDKGVLRSLHLRARLNDDPRFRERENRAWEELFPRLEAGLLEFRDRIRHRDPETAIRIGFQTVFFGLREFILWEPLRREIPCDLDSIVRELSEMFLAYLFEKEEDSP